MFNAHLHLDRAATLDDRYLAHANVCILANSHISLQTKHHLINAIHTGPAYDPEDLERRVNDTIEIMVAANTVRADTMVDVTDDVVGLSALQKLKEITDRRRAEIDVRIAAYSPLGFIDKEPGRWAIFEKGARIADFLGSLPEADDKVDYPSHIGFEEHCVRMLDLAKRLGLMLHVHTDQRNEASERGTERLIEMVRRHGGPVSTDGTPMVWAVHMISPSTYDDDRHKRLVEGLLECNIGVISCPSAALGMRQLRPLYAPTYNSIPRVLELAAAGVHVRLGSDNVADICSPSTTADLVDEVFVLSAAIRFYQTSILARLASGQKLSSDEREAVREHLAKNDQEIARVVHARIEASY
jgi:cytosine/adenosine deaminase-related metal-dependent hydrolase